MTKRTEFPATPVEVYYCNYCGEKMDMATPGLNNVSVWTEDAGYPYREETKKIFGLFRNKPVVGTVSRSTELHFHHECVSKALEEVARKHTPELLGLVPEKCTAYSTFATHRSGVQRCFCVRERDHDGQHFAHSDDGITSFSWTYPDPVKYPSTSGPTYNYFS